MTKTEWDQVKDSLAGAFGLVHLVVDGYELTLQVQRTAPLKYEIMPYVNGQFEGRWLTQKTDEAVRFMCLKVISAYKPSEKARLTKQFGKKAVKEFIPGLDKTSTYYAWGWTSFAALKRHLLAHNKSIEMKKKEV